MQQGRWWQQLESKVQEEPPQKVLSFGLSSKQVNALADKKIIKIICGLQSSFAISATGKLYCLLTNSDVEGWVELLDLSHERTIDVAAAYSSAIIQTESQKIYYQDTNSIFPIKFFTAKSVRSIHASIQFFIVLLENGQLYTFGLDSTVVDKSTAKVVQVEQTLQIRHHVNIIAPVLQSPKSPRSPFTALSNLFSHHHHSKQKQPLAAAPSSSEQQAASTTISTSSSPMSPIAVSQSYINEFAVGKEPPVENYTYAQSTTIAAVYNGHCYHCFLLTESNDLYGWGVGSKGQLGTGKCKSIQKRPKLVKGFHNIRLKQMALGDDWSTALMMDGSLYFWGNNTRKPKLIWSTPKSNILVPTLVQFGGHDIQSIHASLFALFFTTTTTGVVTSRTTADSQPNRLQHHEQQRKKKSYFISGAFNSFMFGIASVVGSLNPKMTTPVEIYELQHEEMMTFSCGGYCAFAFTPYKRVDTMFSRRVPNGCFDLVFITTESQLQ